MANFFLSCKGYKALHFPQDQIPQDPQFQGGMRASQAALHDPAPQFWEAGYRHPLDAMILLADSHKPRLHTVAQRVLDEMRGAATVVAVEHGTVQRNAHHEPVEHFGYVDGISQPLFLTRDLENERNRSGTQVYNPFAPLRLILVKDPNGKEACSYGSYLVFRKLEQNVRGFKEREEELAAALGLTGEDEERAGALVVGRFEDGTPVTLQFGDGMHQPVFNNFTYNDDRDGVKCPVHAHIRKVNPRLDEDREHRIARRGMTYGERQAHLEDRPTEGVGLLFMCFQSNIASQFEYIQLRANAEGPGQGAPGLDPIIGQVRDGDAAQPQSWPKKWGEPDTPQGQSDFHGFVKLQGGEYFFAPSISFLKTLYPPEATHTP